MKKNDQGIKDKIDELNQTAWDTRVNDSTGSFKLSGQSLELLKNVDYPKGKAEALKCHGFALVRLSKNEEAVTCLNEALSIFESLDDLKGVALVCEFLGIIQRNWGNFSSSLELLKKSLRLSRQKGFLEGEGTSLYQTGVTYKYLGNYEQALDYYHQCLSISRSAGFTLMEAYAINVIGAVYFEIQNYEAALNYYQQGLVIRLQSGDKWGEAGSLDNIGSVYLKLKDWKKATDYCERSLAISDSNNDKRGKANCLFHLAEIYRQRNEWNKADIFSERSLQIRQELGDKKGEAEILLFLGGLKRSATQSTGGSELDFLNKALKISNEINAADLSGKSHWALYEFYKRAQNYEQSLMHFEMYDAIEKQLHKDAVNQKVLNFEISHRAQASEKETEKFRLKNEELAKLNAEIKSQKEETEKALAKLKEAQSQLIQAEKMASLGELTAGIAHEIQNPLNFVNNFSEVNKELISELVDEVDKGNTEEVLAIANNIKDNEEKINHHGKRADAIVKGMLQHSRANKGEKQPTDINALCDEYLRLSYHGLRAKDKNFNADFKTDFDDTIGKINIVPQDIGRVLLNLYNNSFYAVAEKMKNPYPLKGQQEYEPIVSVRTKAIKPPSEPVPNSLREGLGVLITVSDNGNGISQNIVDKIFQPFFTTKLTGQGTGLGLSLSYDIIKAHGGEIKVETKEGEGTDFIIQLPNTK
ncbi:MAG: tetratricopeptide repeat protein [Ginsengibacter sp.]